MTRKKAETETAVVPHVSELEPLEHPEQPQTGGSFIRHENNRLERVEHPPEDDAAEPAPVVEGGSDTTDDGDTAASDQE